MAFIVITVMTIVAGTGYLTSKDKKPGGLEGKDWGTQKHRGDVMHT